MKSNSALKDTAATLQGATLLALAAMFVALGIAGGGTLPSVSGSASAFLSRPRPPIVLEPIVIRLDDPTSEIAQAP